LRGLLGCHLRGQLGTLFLKQFSLALFFLDPRGLNGTLGFGNSLRLSLFANAAAFLFNGLLHPQTGLFTRLCARRGEVTVLGAVQICPGIEGRYVFRGLGRIMQHFAICHLPPLRPSRFDPIPGFPPPSFVLCCAANQASYTHMEGFLARILAATLLTYQ
jgi:hypothetical protein